MRHYNDKIFRNAEARCAQKRAAQEEAIRVAKVRQRARMSGDNATAAEALSDFGAIQGLDIELLTGMRRDALNRGDNRFANLCQNMANNATSEPRDI